MKNYREWTTYYTDIFTNRYININVLFWIYSVLIISLADRIELIGVRLYITLIASQLFTWIGVVEKESKYRMLKSFYKKLMDTEGAERNININACKILAIDKSIVENTFLGVCYILPMVFAFLVINSSTSILGMTGSIFCIIIMLEIIWVMYIFTDWALISNDIKKEK